MSELEFWSKDGRFGLKVMPAEVKKILRLCRRSHPHGREGFYSVVTPKIIIAP